MAPSSTTNSADANAGNKFEDLSGVAIKPGDNPYDALINACQGSPVSRPLPRMPCPERGGRSKGPAWKGRREGGTRRCETEDDYKSGVVPMVPIILFSHLPGPGPSHGAGAGGAGQSSRKLCRGTGIELPLLSLGCPGTNQDESCIGQTSGAVCNAPDDTKCAAARQVPDF